MIFDAAQFQAIYTQSNADMSAPVAVDLSAAFKTLLDIANSRAARADVASSSTVTRPSVPASDAGVEARSDSFSTEVRDSVDEIINNLQSISLIRANSQQKS